MAGLQLPLLKPTTTWTPPTAPMNLSGYRGRLAFDVETRDEKLQELGPGVARGDAYIIGMSMATEDGRKAYYPMRHEGGGNCDWNVAGWAKAVLNQFEGELVGAQLLYDLEHAAAEGITFPKVKRLHDVLVAEPLIDEWQMSYSLDNTAKRRLGESKDEEHLRRVAAEFGWRTNSDVKKNLWRMSGTDCGAYGEGDADLPLRILPVQLKLLEDEQQTFVYDLETELLYILLAMRQRGVRVNLRRAREVERTLTAERDRWVTEVKRIAGPTAELLKPESLGPHLESYGIEVPRTKKKGSYSITKELFEKHKGLPLIDAIAAGRRVGTLLSILENHVFGHAIPEAGSPGYGRIHSTFRATKSDDGGTIARFSSEKPCLHQIPSRQSEFDDGMEFDESVVELMRGVFEPDEGERWSRHDESQIEYRYLVHYAVGRGAQAAKESYRKDPKTDFHKMTAMMAGVDPEDSVKRKRVKNLNFCKVYGGGVDKMAVTFNCSIEQAEKISAEYDFKLPFVGDTFKAVSKIAVNRGYVKTILGRRQRFPLFEPVRGRGLRPLPYDAAVAEYGKHVKRAWGHKALNRVLQGSAAEHMKMAMVKYWRAGLQNVLGAPLMTVHDELDLSMPDTPEGHEAALEANRIMADAIELTVPVICEQEIGANWGETS